ncbi:MAG: glycoside hydrolase family 99-like domain-containing protein [Lachnospiraceae bacterium]|nr:glycoside hydrolase family 99-like domain-containing protein [Lachnospiraceae bacterium]
MDKIKIPQILAIYLPQFHETEDNNLWWGKGFTDWETVKTAEKYFPEHNEPRIPLNSCYYDLSQKETMERQAKLAADYGVSGFCFYHYYFKNGKKELELPAENLLKWKDIRMPFCFNWASESWIRSWSRISGNVWAEKYEKGAGDTANGILAEQDYGTYEDWTKHFEYLLPFFQDDRYIKKDGKPVFIFYSPNDIKPLGEMTKCWRKLAREAGLEGLYLIGSRLNAPNPFLDAAIIYEPRNSINKLNASGKAVIRDGVRCFEYDDIWTCINASNSVYGYKTYFCGVSGYDDTPRRGISGECLINATPDIFRRQLEALMQKSIYCGNDFLFINAWNEWGEGMYLEPDETDGYGYLNAIKNAVNASYRQQKEEVDDEGQEAIKAEMNVLNYNAQKFKNLFELIDKWLFLEQENKVDFAKYFKLNGINSVAIYGMAALGKHVLIQLRKEGAPPLFGIDRYVGQFGDDFKIYRPEEDFPDVDAVIITAYDTNAVYEQMKDRCKGKLIALEDIIGEMAKW